MSKMEEAMATIPPYLLNKFTYKKIVLTPGEVFGASELWSIIVKEAGGDPLEIIYELQNKLKEKEK